MKGPDKHKTAKTSVVESPPPYPVHMENALKRGALNVGATANAFGWMRSGSFDLAFIVGVTAIALLSAALSVAYPRLFPLILLLDVWILGYHHVIATFTRLTFDLESYREHKFLITWLPIIVAIPTIGAVIVLGPWILMTTYLYWQWFHYTRQAYGIARIYYRKSNPTRPGSNLLEQLTVYSVPLYGILYRSWHSPEKFLGLELKVLPTPFWVVRIAAIASVVIVGWWLVAQVLAYRKGEMKLGYTLFMLSHLTVFMTGYILIDNINYGWLCLNVWHNAQYVMLVWMYNNNRFNKGIDPRHRFLSTISQTRNVWIYFAVCLTVSTIVYLSSSQILALISVAALPVAMVFYQTINFHHYLVDGIIWKLRRKPGKTLGLAN